MEPKPTATIRNHGKPFINGRGLFTWVFQNGFHFRKVRKANIDYTRIILGSWKSDD